MKAATALIHLVAALFLAAPALAAEPVRIGVSLGLTGKYAELGLMHQRAYELWRDEINERGGLLGRPVETVIIDDGSDPARAAEIYRDLITGQKVDLVFGPYSSGVTTAVAPVVEKHGYPTLLPGACADELWEKGYRNLIGILTPCSRYAVGMLKLAFDKGLRTVAILHADDPFSISVANGVRKWAPALKLEVLVNLQFRKGQKNLTAEARQLRDAGADLLLVAGHFNEAVNARRALTAVPWMPRAYFATIGPALPEWKHIMGSLAEGAFTASIWEPSVKNPRSWSFLENFRKKYAIESSYHAATAYAAGQILEVAVAQAKSLDRESVRDVLSELDTYSVIGRYKVDRTGMQDSLQPAVVIQWQAGGKEVVWPDDVRTAPPVIGSE